MRTVLLVGSVLLAAGFARGVTIHEAVQYGDKDKVAEMLDKDPALLNARDGEYAVTPLHVAAQRGGKEMIDLLLARGADPDVRSRGAWTPLHQAASSANLPAAQALLDKGAAVNAKNDTGRTPLHLAAGGQRAHSAAVVELLIARKADVNAKDDDGRTPLHLVRDRAMADLLLAKGADLKAADARGGTPLHSAALYGHADVATALLAKGADVQAADRSGALPLHLAARGGYRVVVELLLLKGANLKLEDGSLWTPLHCAAGGTFGSEASHLDTVRLLLDKGADPNAKTNLKRTPLDLARKNGFKKVMELLEQRGGKVGIPDDAP
jgi:ankyrin repeat protein